MYTLNITYKHLHINILILNKNRKKSNKMMNASDMMMSMTNKSDGKLGYTTTVK